MAPIKTKTRLELLRSMRARKAGALGFTLVELMITVAVVGILAAVALPRFLGARAAAEAGARIGEAVGIAKECATWVASGNIGEAPTPTTQAYYTASGCTGGTNGSGAYTITWTRTVAGLNCIGTTTGTTGVSRAVISVTPTGGMSCTFG